MPAKTTLFGGRLGWPRASTPRKFPQEIFANVKDQKLRFTEISHSLGMAGWPFT